MSIPMQMLPLAVKGSVIHGNHIGTGLGMPTANINPDPAAVSGLPYGVYRAEVSLQGRSYRGVSNFGVKPSVQGGTGRPNLETYICDFEGDIYGQEITVTLLEFLRPEQRFNSMEELKAAMAGDIEACRRG